MDCLEPKDRRLRQRQRRKKLWQTTAGLLAALGSLHRRGNRHFAGRWSDGRFTAAALAVIVLVSAVMLWFPNQLGVANDGTVTRTMQNAGLSYLEADRENANDYFTAVYALRHADPTDRSIQLSLLGAAKAVDDLFTGDQLFDVRFLAGLYLLLAIPGWGLLIYAVVGRADAFVEKCVLAGLCVLIIGDVSYVTYFNSLYPEAIYLIGLSYFFGGAMSLQRKGKKSLGSWLAILAGAAVLCLTRRHCWIFGFGAALFCVTQLRLSESTLERTAIALAAGAALLVGLWSFAFAETDFDDTSRIHAMTRGVLLQSANPEKTLSEFGIDGSYAMLTDISLYDQYPAAEEAEYYMRSGFLNQYSTLDIGLYYLRHPGAMLSMLDLGIRSAMNTTRDYCGNYLRSAGMPARARSVFMGAYGVFKARSMPHTAAYPVLLMIVCAVLSRQGWWRKKEPDRFYYVYFCTTMIAFLTIAAHLTEIILWGGDAQLTQYNLISGFSIDILMLFTLSELLHRLNILEEAQVNQS